jgi:hypothetical protein
VASWRWAWAMPVVAGSVCSTLIGLRAAAYWFLGMAIGWLLSQKDKQDG